MTIQNNQRALCECISTRTGSFSIEGKQKPVFILELNAIESGKLLIKYLGCKSSTKGCYTVGHNSDFAKLYRLTLGENPKKRFSEAKHLLGHFVESRFFAEYKSAIGSTGKHYLKVTHIEPENPCKNNEWTASGALKKVRKKSKKPPPEVPDKYRNTAGQVPEHYRTSAGRQNATGR